MATSRLQREVSQLLSTHLGHYTIRENRRPDRLAMETGERLELDFYIEEPKIAIEVQGQQHYTYIPHFHRTYAAFEAQLFRDREKKRLCKNRGVTLYEIVSLDEAFEIAIRLYPEIPRPIHPNALRQSMRLTDGLCKSKKRGKVKYLFHLFTEHERAPRRHLRRLLDELLRFEETKILTLKAHGRIQQSLVALQQHQEMKGEIQFSNYEQALLKAAQSLIDD